MFTITSIYGSDTLLLAGRSLEGFLKQTQPGKKRHKLIVYLFRDKNVITYPSSRHFELQFLRSCSGMAFTGDTVAMFVENGHCYRRSGVMQKPRATWGSEHAQCYCTRM